MRESRAYLIFFKRNLLLLILPPLLLGFLGFHYQYRKPPVFNEGSLFEQNYSLSDVNTKIALTDQIINTLRSNNLQKSLEIPSEVSVSIYKPSPLSIQMDISSVNRELVLSSMQKLQTYLMTNYQVKEIGVKQNTFSYADFLSGILVGAAIGLSLSLVIILTKVYFEKF